MQAPFNFVPVSKKVFTPGWADQISHDVPFSDGEDGIIELKITAENMIYVRNGHTPADRNAQNERFLNFSNIDSRPFIPSTSLKGALRNVLEILSFSRLTLDEKMKFATRDWYNEELYDLKQKQNQIRCGWLKYDENQQVVVVDCGMPMRINHKRIDAFFSVNGIATRFEDWFSRDSKFKLNKPHVLNGKSFDPKTAVFKYALIGFGHTSLTDVSFQEDNDYANEHQPNRVLISSTGSSKGTIVFTGSPDKWAFPHDSIGDGKFYEFVFPKPSSSSLQNPLQISEIDFAHFKFFHSDSPDWAYWNEKLNLGKSVPIFFRKSNDLNNPILDFGMAFLYKKPFLYSPYELLSENHKKGIDELKPDLAECIFGYTGKNSSLKGRVQISHAFAHKIVEAERESLVLGSPKASYYPIYVSQPNGQNGIVNPYQTYSDSQASIAGWKRYPVRASVWKKTTDNEAIDTNFIPLGKGSEFIAKIRFHNLRKAEIGALLSTLTFHNNDGYYHLIGMGKPYGYGKVRIQIDHRKSQLKYSSIDYMIAFEEELVESPQLFNGRLQWHTSDEIKQLFTISFDYNLAGTQLLYMTMSNTPADNDFLNAKKQHEYLESYTKLMNDVRNPKSLYAEVLEEKNKQKEQLKRELEEAEIQKEKQRLADIDEKARLEAEERKKIRAKEAEKGINLSTVNPTSKKAWDELKGIVERFICAYRADNNYKRILVNFPVGALPVSEHEIVLTTIRQIINHLNQKEKEKWLEKFDKNPFLKKIAEWVGKEKAVNFLK